MKPCHPPCVSESRANIDGVYPQHRFSLDDVVPVAIKSDCHWSWCLNRVRFSLCEWHFPTLWIQSGSRLQYFANIMLTWIFSQLTANMPRQAIKLSFFSEIITITSFIWLYIVLGIYNFASMIPFRHVSVHFKRRGAVLTSPFSIRSSFIVSSPHFVLSFILSTV